MIQALGYLWFSKNFRENIREENRKKKKVRENK